MELLTEISERETVQKALESSKEELRFLSTRLLESQEDERRRLAAELHDDVAPFLGSIKFGLEASITKLDKLPKEKETLTTIVGMVRSVVNQIEHIRHNLRPSMLDDFGVIESLDWYCGEFADIYKHISVSQTIQASENNIPENLKIVLFRVVQEALNNVAKHSNADKVKLGLISEENTLHLLIEDNGNGFDVSNPEKYDKSFRRGFGLVSMQERTEATGGLFKVESFIGNGVKIHARWVNL